MELQFPKYDRVLDYLYGQKFTDGYPGPIDSLLLRETQPRNDAQIVNKFGFMCIFSKTHSVYIPRQTRDDEYVPWPVMILLDAVHGITDHMSRSACRLLGPIPYPQGSGYNAAVAIGYYLLLPPEAMEPGSFLQAYAKCHHLPMDAFRNGIASTTNGEEHAKQYALASLYYVLDATFKLLNGDERGAFMMQNSSAASYSHRLNEFLQSDNLPFFINNIFVLIQNLVQEYNIMVSKDKHKQMNRPVLHGIFQIIRAPRPWILLQLLQMRCQFDKHNTDMFKRGVQVIFTDFLPVAMPQYGASAWLRAVDESNVLCIEAPDNLRNAAPGNNKTDIHFVLGMLVATAGSDTSFYSEYLNAFIFEGIHVLSRWRK